MEVQAPLHNSSLLHNLFFHHISSLLPSHRARTAATRGQVFIALLTATNHLSCCSVRNEGKLEIRAGMNCEFTPR